MDPSRGPRSGSVPASSDVSVTTFADCLLMATAAHGVLGFDEDLRITVVGPGVAGLFGGQVEDLADRLVTELLTPVTSEPRSRAGLSGDTGGRVREKRAAPDEGGALDLTRQLRAGVLTGRWMLHAGAGQSRVVDVTCSTSRDEEGRLRGGVLVLKDAEAVDVADRKLADSETQFRLVFEKSPTAMAVVSLAAATRGRIRRVNPAMEQFTGRRQRELFSLTMAHLLHPDEHQAHLAYLRSAAEKGLTEPDGVIRRFLHRDGSERLGRKSTALVTPLGARESYLLIQLLDITDQHTAQQALAHAALHDPLTGLANRALFTDRLELAVTAETRACQGLTLLYLDLDRFKPVNDTHGHQAGDAVLVAVADRLRSAMRAEDTVARLGGDEFAVICPGLREGDVGTVTTRVHAALLEPVSVPDGSLVTISASIGSASVEGRITAQGLVSAADAAMYRMKQR